MDKSLLYASPVLPSKKAASSEVGRIDNETKTDAREKAQNGTASVDQKNVETKKDTAEAALTNAEAKDNTSDIGQQTTETKKEIREADTSPTDSKQNTSEVNPAHTETKNNINGAEKIISETKKDAPKADQRSEDGENSRAEDAFLPTMEDRFFGDVPYLIEGSEYHGLDGRYVAVFRQHALPDEGAETTAGTASETAKADKDVHQMYVEML